MCVGVCVCPLKDAKNRLEEPIISLRITELLQTRPSCLASLLASPLGARTVVGGATELFNQTKKLSKRPEERR